MSNQFTKAQEAGLKPGDPDFPKSENQFSSGQLTEHPEAVRQKIRASMVARFLESVVESDNEKTTDRVAAAKILFDKTLASLSSIEQTNHDGDAITTEQAEAKLRMLISKAEPALLSRILGERARQHGDTPVSVPDPEGEQAA